MDATNTLHALADKYFDKAEKISAHILLPPPIKKLMAALMLNVVTTHIAAQEAEHAKAMVFSPNGIRPLSEFYQRIMRTDQSLVNITLDTFKDTFNIPEDGLTQWVEDLAAVAQNALLAGRDTLQSTLREPATGTDG